jgi:hypothetical protein
MKLPAWSERVIAQEGFKLVDMMSAIIAFLLLFATSGGLFIEWLYKDSASTLQALFGQDLVTFLVVLPLLIGAQAVAMQGSVRALMVWLGTLGYVCYLYTMMAFGVSYNEFFVVYVALFGLSLIAMIASFVNLDMQKLERHIFDAMPTKLLAAYSLTVGLMFLLLWLSAIANDVMTGIEGATPPNPIYVLDLAVVIPLFLLAGVWSWQGKSWGVILAGLLSIKTAFLFLSVSVGQLFVRAAGLPFAWADIALYTLLTVASLMILAIYLSNLREERQ